MTDALERISLQYHGRPQPVMEINERLSKRAEMRKLIKLIILNKSRLLSNHPRSRCIEMH